MRIGRRTECIRHAASSQIECARCRTLKIETRELVRPFDAFEWSDERMRGFTNAIAVEVEAAVAAPAIADPLQAPGISTVAATLDDVAPVLDEVVRRECA